MSDKSTRKKWSESRLDGKTVLITGANTGIGKETARDLARRGALVIMSCRDVEKGEAAAKEIIEETGNSQLVVKKLDLADTKSIREFAQQVNEEYQQLNILINNAGVMMCPYYKTVGGFELQFGVNHLGHFLLTYLLIDLIKKSAPSRIINVSSKAHKMGSIQFDDLNSEKSYNSVKAYAQSKLANIMFTMELARKLEGTDVLVFTLHPGVVRTQLARYLNPAVRFGLAMLRPFTKSPTSGAETTVYCAVAQGLEKETGQYFSNCERATCSSSAHDDEKAKKLWQVSCQMLEIDWQ
ncbi:retinol dehydrogenase 12-like isoform X1 [Carcharodon carcharias]|uniref:retinol dehydrogenase 12-like isoform X1 n=1 Tax=Carcharodon carcharias TaxID=13397 RepID=UPI001B7EA8CE|nr:retinol dehydrogenase 12-like isoform X1 [Carcharodon carcharias]